jgi:hypothetical protein
MANKKVSQLTSKPSVLVTDLFPIADPSTGQLYKTTISDLGTAIGSGVSSVNGLVGAVVLDTDDIQELVSPTNKWFTDTRARAALSASSPLAYNSGTGVFSIPAATSSQNGYLTSTDWTTFNSKQAALSGTGFVKISGTTISYDNSTYALDSAVVKLTGNQTIAGVKTFTTGIVADVTTGGTQGFASTNSSTSGSSIFLQNNSTSIGNAIGINNTSTADGISIGNDTSGRAIYISNATASGSGKGISIDNYNGGIGIEVGSDSTADAIKVLHLSGRAFNIQSSGGGFGVIINNTTASTSAPFTIQKQGANRITFTDAGAGTFVSTISAAGATLTGALSGTSATFSSSVTASKLIVDGASAGNVSQFALTRTDSSWGIFNETDLRFYQSNSNTSSPSSVKMVITSSGNVGIGTTAPATPLEVNGVIRSSKNEIGFQTLGLGSKLEVYSASYENIAAFRSIPGDGINPYLLINTSSSGITLEENGSSYGALMFKTGATERMRITSAGHIQTNGNPVYAYSGSISIGGSYQTIFAAVSGGVYLVSVTTDSADGTFGLLTVINDPDKSLGMIYGNNISLQFSGDNVQMKSTNGSTYNTTWTATRLK